jgi:TRAP-type C4-dicarboxylate transport system substrate-binding protein
MHSKFDRRTFLTATGGLLAAGALPHARAQGKPKMRFSAAFTEQDLRAEAYKNFAAAMKNDFDFEPYWNNTLFKQGTELVALQRGNVEIVNLSPLDIAKLLRAWSLLSSAYLFRDPAQMR